MTIWGINGDVLAFDTHTVVYVYKDPTTRWGLFGRHSVKELSQITGWFVMEVIA